MLVKRGRVPRLGICYQECDVYRLARVPRLGISYQECDVLSSRPFLGRRQIQQPPSPRHLF